MEIHNRTNELFSTKVMDLILVLFPQTSAEIVRLGFDRALALGHANPLLNSEYHPRSLQVENTEKPQSLRSVVVSLETVIPDRLSIEYYGDTKGSQAPSQEHECLS